MLDGSDVRLLSFPIIYSLSSDIYHLVPVFNAGVAESADARDLKSLGPQARAGSIPAPGRNFPPGEFLPIHHLRFTSLAGNLVNREW